MDYLTWLANQSSGTMDPLQIKAPQQSLATPAQPVPAQQGALDKIGNILSHPAVQGLLGAWFGAVSSPRRAGFGGAIGRGGLQGLGAFDQARQQQLLMPLMQAKMQLAQQQIPEAQAHTQNLQSQGKLAQGRLESLQPFGIERATALAQQVPEFAQAMPVQTLAAMSTTQVFKALDDFQKRQLEAPKVKAETEAAGATAALRRGQLGALPSLEAQRGAQTQALNRGMALMPTALPGAAPVEAMPATSVAPAEVPPPAPPESAGEATHEQDVVGPDGKKTTFRLVGGKWVPAT